MKQSGYQELDTSVHMLRRSGLHGEILNCKDEISARDRDRTEGLILRIHYKVVVRKFKLIKATLNRTS